MSRLPIPGSDDGSWGAILNDYLAVEHNADGSLKVRSDGTLTNLYSKPGGGIPASDLAGSVQTSLTAANTGDAKLLQSRAISNSAPSDGQVLQYVAASSNWAPATVTSSGSVADASSSVKGVVQLSGDLAGTAASPTVAAGAITDSKIASGAAIARSKLDSSTQTSLGKADSALQSAPVSSVAGKTGVVALVEGDVANLTTDLAGKVTTTAGGQEAVVTANSGSSYAVNAGNANLFFLTLTANCSLSLSGAVTGKSCAITVILKQDSTGSRTVTWPASVHWSGGSAPTLTTTAGKVDFFGLLSVDGGSNWYGFVSGLNY